MKRIIYLCLLLMSRPLAAKDYALVVGVLNWQDSDFASFSAEKRQDKLLAQYYRKQGYEVIDLYDEKATTAAIVKNLRKLIAKADGRFVFYYTGHGVRKQKQAQTIFASYDIMGYENGLEQQVLKKELKKFKGTHQLLMADCCYSGALATIASEIPRTSAVCSVHENSLSTGNWTFTRTLLEVLQGCSYADADKNGKITFSELCRELRHVMRWTETQLVQYHLNKDEEIAKVKESKSHGQFVSANGQIYRLTGIEDKYYLVLRYAYNSAEPKKIQSWQTPVIKHFLKGGLVQAKVGGKWYPGRIVSIERGAYTIRFDGYGNEYDEVLWPSRLKLSKP